MRYAEMHNVSHARGNVKDHGVNMIFFFFCFRIFYKSSNENNTLKEG